MKPVVLSGWLTLPLIGAVIGLVGCSPKNTKQATVSNASTNEAAENALKNPKPQDFSQPIIASKSPLIDPSKLPLTTIPIAGFQQSTRATNQAQPSSSSRDPFSTILSGGATLTTLTQFSRPQTDRSLTPVLKKPVARKIQAIAQTLKKQKPKTLPPLAFRPPIPLSAIPPVPIRNSFPPSSEIPDAPIGVPNDTPNMIVPPSPTALADEVEVTGVIQAGDRVMAIVKAPEESTARYVNSGDTLSNGRVIVREIRLGQGGQPVVVLEQNGQRVTKSIGAIARMSSFRGL